MIRTIEMMMRWEKKLVVITPEMQRFEPSVTKRFLRNLRKNAREARGRK